MATFTIILTDQPETEDGVPMDIATKVDVQADQLTQAMNSPAIVLGMALRRILDDASAPQELATAMLSNPRAFWQQLRDLTGLKDKEPTDGQ